MNATEMLLRGSTVPPIDHRQRRLILLALLVTLVALGFALPGRVPAAVDYPQTWVVPVRSWIGSAMDWLVNDADLGLFTFRQLTRGIAWLLNWPLALFNHFLWEGFELRRGLALPPLSWLGAVLAMSIAGHAIGGWRLMLLNAACFGYMALFGLWQSAMMTLSSVAIAVPFGSAIGILVGIAAYRRPVVERCVIPTLDFMQTVPVFAYLLPVLFLFGFGPVAAMIATMIYAMPAMARATILGLKTVPTEVVEFGRIAGASRRQLTWQVMIPAALPTLLVGINQVIMLSLNAVIIASLIGAGGLGFDVLKALRTLRLGRGIEAGVAIVLIAVVLDRMTFALAQPRRSHIGSGSAAFPIRYAHLTAAVTIAVATSAAGFAWPWLASLPKAFTVTTGPVIQVMMDYIIIHWYNTIEMTTAFLYLNVLNPTRDLLLALPWVVVVGATGTVGWYLGGLRLGALVTGLSLFIAISGFWEPAMITVYLIGFAVIVAAAIGLPLGVWASLNDRVSRLLRVICDTLQTLPSFVYIVPVVMLFRVGDFPALIAVILYALPPAIRYTDFGLRRVDAQLIELGRSVGCTRSQLLLRVRFPLAMPEILLGVNQTILFGNFDAGDHGARWHPRPRPRSVYWFEPGRYRPRPCRGDLRGLHRHYQ